MSLKTHNGKLLARNGHLCTTCCSHCINFHYLFPWIYPSAAPDYAPRGYYCGNIEASTTYIKSIQNPLPVRANLVVVEIVRVDDDLEIDGVSIGGRCALPVSIPAGTILSTQDPGGVTVLTIVDNYGVNTGALGIACWIPVESAILGSPNVTLSRSRYETCRACADSLQEGFACRLVTTCCFGRDRTNPDFHCPAGKW